MKDLVCPFSRNTFRTLAIGGTQRSPNEKADGCRERGEEERTNVEMSLQALLFFNLLFSQLSCWTADTTHQRRGRTNLRRSVNGRTGITDEWGERVVE